MRFAPLFLLCFGTAFGADSFITKDEYAKLLYENPRGISCAKCHGEKGEGKIIASYKEEGKKRHLETTPIYMLDYARFKKGTQRAKGVMPQYYLTENEIAALYYYLQTINKPKQKEE
ncbi:MAG: hypothetical protein KU37_10270 [Sulfuricurvum sp. PC08-66]|nr:MAG: hypothetical protein KU37_10270 [Sulfuricurvum sp. PC08-66]